MLTLADPQLIYLIWLEPDLFFSPTRRSVLIEGHQSLWSANKPAGTQSTVQIYLTRCYRRDIVTSRMAMGKM